MLDRSHIEIPRLISNPSAALVARAAVDKGLKVYAVAKNVYVVEGEGKKEVFEYTMAGSIGHIAKLITWDKGLCKKFFNKEGVPTPQGVKFRNTKSISRAIKFMKGSLARSFVVKPVDGVMGKMVFLDVDSEEVLREKCSILSKRHKNALIEEQVSGVECRYFVVGDKVVAVTERKPASVVGDGVKSLKELVEIKNAGREGHLSLVPISIDDETISLLRDQGYELKDVPGRGVNVKLKRVSNISQGGDSVDITDEVHSDVKSLAVAAVKAIPGLPYAGLDIIAEDHRAPLAEQEAVVLEVNWNPMVRMHHAPAIGEPRDVAGEIIDHLFFR